MAKRNLAEIFETETCSRCDGTGRYSFCPQHGTRCFKCWGKGRVYTIRGQAAVDYLRSLRQVKASDLVIGQRVFIDGSGIVPNTWQTLQGVEPDSREGFILLAFTNTRISTTLNDLFIPGIEDEQLDRLIAQALAYQNTLTKSGTVAKRKAKA